MEYRPFFLAREWVRMGHEVTIVAASFSHVRTKEVSVKGSFSEEHIEGVRYIWLKTPSYNGNSIGRIYNMLSFVSRLFAKGGLFSKNGKLDLVIASSTYPLDIIPAFKIARTNNARLVFEVHDLWPLSPMLLGNMSRWHPYIFALQRAEDFAYRKANCVVSLLPKAKDYMISRGMDRRKFAHIPNGLDLEEWNNASSEMPPEHADVFQRLRDEGRFVILYAGAHGLANALDTLIDAAADLIDTKATFVLVGKGPEKERLSRRVAPQGPANVIFLPPVSRASLPNLLEAADACYIGLANHPLFQYGVSPNKLLDYMMAGKPIIHAIDAGNDLVAESGCGISVMPEDPTAIARAVITLMNLTPREREIMGAKGHDYVAQHHDYRRLARQFLEAVESGQIELSQTHFP